MTPDLLTGAELADYFDAIERLVDVIQSDQGEGAWAAPSALARMSTGAVAAHAVTSVLRLEQQLTQEDEPGDRRRVEIPEFYGPNRMDGPEDDDPLFVALRHGAEKLAAKGRGAVLEQCARSVAVLREL